MFVLACVTTCALVALIGSQSVFVWSFVRALRGHETPLMKDADAPKAVVILCLRGTDPFLKQCISGLLNQDYPSYQIRIVVDSPHDPAHQVLADIFRSGQPANVAIENLFDKSPNCSLKCSSLRQVMRSLDPQFEIVAQLDADTIAHPTWLRELVTGLHPDDVGVATGNRWYMPKKPTIGSIVRYTWNAAAVLQMHWHSVAWGGTLAIKSRILRESDLLDKWGMAFCEDTMLRAQLEKLGLRTAFVPSLMMINRETVTVPAFYQWVKRQMVNTRLYHPAWRAVLLHGFISTLVPLASIALLAFAVSKADWRSTAMLATGLWGYGVSLLFSLLPVVKLMRQIAERRGEPSRWIHGWKSLSCAAVLPVTQVIQFAALISASFARSSQWRGIRYYINGPWHVRMEEYLPYPATVTIQADESL